MSYIGAKPAEQILSSADIQDGAISTVDLADASITQAKLASGVAGTGPTFSAYPTSPQNITQNVFTKVNYGTEDFDTNNNFASSRFTPTVAGYYQLTLSVGFNETSTTGYLALYKNGSEYKDVFSPVSGSPFNAFSGTTLVYANGSTDYFEVYIYMANTQNCSNNYVNSYFQGVMVRSA